MGPAKIGLRRPLDVVIAGLSVVDVIGWPVGLKRPPKPGGLQELEGIVLTTGGNTANSGIGLAKLGFRVGVITRVGDDGLGRFIRSGLSSQGINLEGMTVDAKAQTSSTMVCVDACGERTFFHTRGCLRNFTPRDVLGKLQLIRRARMFAFGYLGLLPECERGLGHMLKTVREKAGVGILLDTGGTPVRNDRLMREILPQVDYFIPSYEEAVALTGRKSPEKIVKAFMEMGARSVVGVKLGAEGCFISYGGEGKRIPALKVRKVVDATGAGDAFVSGFLAGVLRGFDPFAAARIGNAVAASCVTAVGASTAIRPLGAYLHRH